MRLSDFLIGVVTIINVIVGKRTRISKAVLDGLDDVLTAEKYPSMTHHQFETALEDAAKKYETTFPRSHTVQARAWHLWDASELTIACLVAAALCGLMSKILHSKLQEYMVSVHGESPEQAVARDSVVDPSARSTASYSFTVSTFLGEATSEDAIFIGEFRSEMPSNLTEKISSSCISQVLVTLAVSLVFSMGPVMTDWAAITGQTTSGETIKKNAFLPGTIVFLSRLIALMVVLSTSFLNGVCFSCELFQFKKILPWVPIAVGFVAADFLEIVANSNSTIDPASYVVLSQVRLACSAVAMRLVLGKTQNLMQWVLVLAAMLVGVAWEWRLVAAGNRDKEHFTGVLLISCKVVVSVVVGILCYYRFEVEESEFFMVQLVRLLLLCTLGSIPLIPLNIWSTSWSYGILGSEGLDSKPAWVGLEAIMLVLFYAYQGLVVALCVNTMSALSRALCSSFSCMLTCAVFWAYRGIMPSTEKATLSTALVMIIAMYGFAKRVR